MKYSTLQQILEYIVREKIRLTSDERKFLFNILEKNSAETKFSLVDFIRWYNSLLRNENVTKALSTQQIEKKELDDLLHLKSYEIQELFNCVNIKKLLQKGDFESLGYLILSYSRISKYADTNHISSLNNASIKRRIINILAMNPKFCEQNQVEKIILDPTFLADSDEFTLIQQLVKSNNTDAIDVIHHMTIHHHPKNIYFRRKYIALEIEGKNPEAEYAWDLYDNTVEKASRRPRAFEAVMRQDSPKKMNQVIIAAANESIYHNKQVFDLIQSQEDGAKMLNLLSLAGYNRFRKDFDFLKRFSELSYEDQCKILKEIVSEEEREKEERRKLQEAPMQVVKEEILQEFQSFLSSKTRESQKRLLKTLNTNLSKYPKLGNKETAKKRD